MTEKNLTVYKANQVIEASYRLTKNEERVILACIGQVNSQEALVTTDEFVLLASDFAQIFGVSKDKLQSVAKTLYQRSLTIHDPFPNKPRIKKLETRWISSIGYMPEDGKIKLCFAQDMLPFLGALKGEFTKYKLKHVAKMKSIYGNRLYELLMQWQTIGKREVDIDWLKQCFQIEEQYPDMADFKKRVLEPAIKDINEHSNLNVAWMQRKTGRRVTHLTFTFAEKAIEKPMRKPREKMILGIKESEVVRLAKPGETWEAAAIRIKQEKMKAKQAVG